MKKSLIVLAVSGVMLAPMVAQADATLYGEAQFRLTDQKDHDLNAESSTTRLGVKGTVDNDIDGLTTAYQIEWDFNADASSGLEPTASSDVLLRKSLVFLKGDWGQVTFGRQNNPAEVMDFGMGHKFGQTFSLTPDRYGNAISYATLNRYGFELSGGVSMDAGDASEDDVDASAIALTYGAYGVGVALAYYDVADEFDITGGKLTYTTGDLTVGANYQEKDFEDATTDDVEVFTVGGKYTFGKTAVYAEYQDIDEANGSANDNDNTLVGVSYNLGSQAQVAVDYASFDKDTGTNANSDALTLEYTINF
ncbi:MAG: porin [Amphritea sp.]